MSTTTATTAMATSRTRRSSFGGGNNTVEQQCMLRVPPELATRINQILQQHDASKDASKSIELDIDIAFGDNEDILQFLKSALKEQASPIVAQQSQQQQRENTSSTSAESSSSSSSSSNNEKEDGKNKSIENGTLHNNEDKIDQRYISDVAYTIKKNRRGRFRFDNEMYPCELLDLPCVIEAYKSIDCKTYYKSGDVSQMILVKNQEELDKEIDRLRIEEEEDVDVGKKKKKDKKHLLTAFENGLTPSTRNITRHWEKQRSDTSKHDIALMFEHFMQLLEEEDPGKVTLEILEDTGEETMEEFSSEEEDSDLETDSSSDSDEEKSSSILERKEPAISISDRYDSPLYSTPTVVSPTPSTVKTPVSVMDEDAKSMGSVEEDEEMFETIMNEESSNQGEEPEEDVKSVSSVEEDEEMFESVINEESSSPGEEEEVEATIPAETTARVDRLHLIERRNAVANELNEKQRELAEKEKQAASIPNLIMRRRFETQIAEKQREVESKKQELAQIEEQLNNLQ